MTFVYLTTQCNVLVLDVDKKPRSETIKKMFNLPASRNEQKIFMQDKHSK